MVSIIIVHFCDLFRVQLLVARVWCAISPSLLVSTPCLRATCRVTCLVRDFAVALCADCRLEIVRSCFCSVVPRSPPALSCSPGLCLRRNFNLQPSARIFETMIIQCADSMDVTRCADWCARLWRAYASNFLPRSQLLSIPTFCLLATHTFCVRFAHSISCAFHSLDFV